MPYIYYFLCVAAEWKENKIFNQDYVLYPVEINCAYTEPGSSVIKSDGVKVKTNVSQNKTATCLPFCLSSMCMH